MTSSASPGYGLGRIEGLRSLHAATRAAAPWMATGARGTRASPGPAAPARRQADERRFPGSRTEGTCSNG